jgi:hypothetical protein
MGFRSLHEKRKKETDKIDEVKRILIGFWQVVFLIEKQKLLGGWKPIQSFETPQVLPSEPSKPKKYL